jgi:hypothetical protein
MAMQTKVVARQWLNSDNVGNPKDTKPTTVKNRGKVLSMRFVPRCFWQDDLFSGNEKI